MIIVLYIGHSELANYLQSGGSIVSTSQDSYHPIELHIDTDKNLVFPCGNSGLYRIHRKQ